MSPPSQTDLPGQLWPPPRTATSRSLSRANETARLTSSLSRQRAISAGCLSCMPFQIVRAESYPGWPESMTGPDRLSPRSLTAALSSSISAPSSEIAGMAVSARVASGGRRSQAEKAAPTPTATAERQN